MFKLQFKKRLVAVVVAICFLFVGCATTSQVSNPNSSTMTYESNTSIDDGSSQEDNTISTKDTSETNVEKKKKITDNQLVKTLSFIVGFIIGYSLVSGL